MLSKFKTTFVLYMVFLSLLLVNSTFSETVLRSSQPLPVAANVTGDFPAPPSTPILYDPGTTIINGDFTVDWSDSTSGAGINVYEFEEATSSAVNDRGYFVNRVGTIKYITPSQYSFVDHPQGTYYFHVRAEDNNGFKSNWSIIQDLTLSFPVISTIQVSNVTQTSATVTWQTNVASNSRVRPRGFYKIYDTAVSPDIRIQGVNYAPVEAHGSDITAAEIDKDLQDFVANNVNAINIFNLGDSALNQTDPTYNTLEQRIFAKCAALGLKFVVRLEAYQKPGFDYGTEDADWIIDVYYSNTIQRANGYSGSILYYMINMPLDDADLIKPSEAQQRSYVTYFYNRLKTINPNAKVFVNFHYGTMDEIDQTSVADIVDGVSIAQYAVRFAPAPYGVNYDTNGNGQPDPGEGPVSTDADYKIIDKDQFDYFIDKLYLRNKIGSYGGAKKVYIDQSGFADLINHWSGTCANRTTKLKAMKLLKEYVEKNPRLNGWFYFKDYDKADAMEQATFGIFDTKVQGNASESVTSHIVVMTDLFPGTNYEIWAKSGGAETAGPSFATLAAVPPANDTPTITITSPAYGGIAVNPGDNFTITWRDEDSDNNALISLYYDTDDRGRDGTLIVSGLLEDDETDGYTWNTAPLIQGNTYYIYAKIDDGINQPEYDYSNGKILTAPVASASSIQGQGYEANKAFDGNLNTRWSSASGVDPQWIQIDFGASRGIYRVVLWWEAAYATAYKIQVSNDGAYWTDVYSTTTGDGGTDDISLTPVAARYVRMYGTQRALPQFGYSLWEFQVYSSVQCSVTYLSPHHYDQNGIPVYNIGTTMNYELHIRNVDSQNLNNLTIQAIQEYHESGTGFNKGNPMPGDSTQTWTNQTILQGLELVLTDSYYIPTGTYAALDQTHLIISQGVSTLYNYSETGIWCPPEGQISGTVTLQGRSNYAEEITFELRRPGEIQPLKTYRITTDSEGNFILADIGIGTYDLTAKSSNTLRAIQRNISIVDGQTTPNINFSLLGGDADNNNVVSLMDFSILRAAMGTKVGDPKWDARADFNDNDQIDMMDFSILRSNYGKSGDK